MSRNERKTGNIKAGGTNEGNRRISQPKSGKQFEGDPLKQKIETVKNVTGWPDEDIIRVLEKYNMDPELTMNNILDGLEGEPNLWNEVVSKKTKAETKSKEPQRRGEHKDGTSPSVPRAGGRGRGKFQDSKDNQKPDPRHRQPIGRVPAQQAQMGLENGSQTVQDGGLAVAQKSAKEVPTLPTKELGVSRIPSSNQPISDTRVTAPHYSREESVGVVQVGIKPGYAAAAAKAAQQSQPPQTRPSTHQPKSRPPSSVTQPHTPQEATATQTHLFPQSTPPQTQTPQAVPQTPLTSEPRLEEKITSREEMVPADTTTSEGAAQAQSQNPSFLYGTGRQYHPPGMKTWKPKDNAQKATITTTETLVEQLSNASIGQRTTVVQTTTLSAPVVLPSALAAALDAQDVRFGDFGGVANYDQEDKPTHRMPSITQGVEAKGTQVGPSDQELRIPSQEQELHSREQDAHQPPVHIPNQPGAYGYGIPVTRPGHFGYPAHFQGYDTAELPHYANYEAEVSGMRQPMLSPYDAQQSFPQAAYQREPSPTDANKYVPRTDNQNASSYRDNKFSQQDVSSTQGQTPTNTAGQGTHAAAQGSYGYTTPMYAYPYIPNQYGSYQNPRTQYAFPQYYRAPYPNYSANTPGYPPTTTPSSYT